MERTGMEAGAVCLHELANLAIGPPEVGAVNFSALHTLLHAIIRHLHIQEGSWGPQGGTGQRPPSGGVLEKGQKDSMEGRLLQVEQQLEALNYFPSGAELIEMSKSGQQGGSSTLRDVWQMMQLKRRLEVNEEGVCKAMSVLQDLMSEVNTLKESHRDVQDQIQKETAGLKEVEEKMEIFNESLTKCPGIKAGDSSPVSEPTQDTDGHVLDVSQTTLPLTQGSNQAKDSALSVEAPYVTMDRMVADILQDAQMEESEQAYERELTHAHPGAPVPHNTGTNCSVSCMNVAPGTPEINPSLLPASTSQELAMLYTRVDALERDKADRTELGLLQKNADNTAMKLSRLNRETQNTDRRLKDLTGLSHHSDQTLEVTSLSATIQDIEKDLSEQRKRQKQEEATKEQSVDDKLIYQQDQDAELFGHIKKTTLRLQEECEQLSKTIGSLIQDHELKQQHIDILYQTVENLDKNKVDKEPTGLEIDVKADKRALESKVSRTLFDATTEHLSGMIQDLLCKVGAQEQDWQRLLQKINVEMENKLDRIELEPLKGILEQCWTDLQRQLQQHPPQYEADEAAGIRKQLIRRFHCISCDRTVDMLVPGAEMLSIPNISGLPAHRSNRPYTVFELNQIRQQSRSDRLPQQSDFGYTSSSRNCGGSHTLTFPQRRYSRLQASTPCTVQKEEFVAGLKEEMFILGQDGHIYRGRRENHLPSIKNKDERRSTAAQQRFHDCNLNGEECLFGCSSATNSDVLYGVSKAHMKFTQGSEQPLPSIKNSVLPTSNQSKWT
ncbi:glutamine-rich protein 2 isoform X2 [Hyla sarda]|uniref:glutamine-rich protein 2 isoform X2 n=1 Tax=Hyla sarda TaxID=327740 RepID=UPI0024C40170|nr:glutamine-rich protein 2 isoform X2 [Hyla sarda]